MFSASCLLCKAAKLTFTYSYIMLVTQASNLNEIYFEFFRQLKGLCASQALSIIWLLSIVGGFEYGLD